MAYLGFFIHSLLHGLSGCEASSLQDTCVHILAWLVFTVNVRCFHTSHISCSKKHTPEEELIDFLTSIFHIFIQESWCFDDREEEVYVVEVASYKLITDIRW